VFSPDDCEHMARALALAERGLFTATPNPRVGCVIVRDDRVVGEGWHERAGAPHAEAHALAMAGEAARGATVYVNLEPCSHHGRTPPCADALAAAGVRRVVAAMEDPNPRVSGGGFRRLREAGVSVECGLLEDEARALNVGFVSRMTRGRPWMRMKIAASLDGRTALAGGASRWITGAEARADGHRWRARACAVLTGIGTVKDDDPLLNVRGLDTPRQPLRIVVDSRLELPLGARILQGGNILVAGAVDDRARIAALREAGADVVVLPNASGKVDLGELAAELGRREVNEVHVEAGHKLNGSLLGAGLVDEVLVYLAPSALGDASRGMFTLGTLKSLDQRVRLQFTETCMIGEDLRVRAKVVGP
jgi:diaminohydroxyphosphoribosylaminopyrimidine deaminase/5-amino-6-(5-phosphoribosylamino)uracil reductase